MLPDKEWSGAVFYTYVRENGNTTIKVVDFCLQDIGNSTYTEYEMNGDTASYYVEHIDTLIGCKVGTLHSHNKMAAFFSSTDIDTLHEAGAQMNNLLSIIVNNAGQYVAKFTELHRIHRNHKIHTSTEEKDSWSDMGDEPKCDMSSYYNDTEKEEEEVQVRCWDCDIEYPKCQTDEALMREYQPLVERFKKNTVINDARKWQQPSMFDNGIDYINTGVHGVSKLDRMYMTLKRFIDGFNRKYNPTDNEIDDLYEMMVDDPGANGIFMNIGSCTMDFL